MTRKWIEANDSSVGKYFLNKNIRFKTPMIRSDFCDSSGAYIVVKGKIRGLLLLTGEVNI